MSLIQPANFVASRSLQSPCGRFRVDIADYQKDKTGWTYCTVAVWRGDEKIAEIERNYQYRGDFFQRQGETWLWTGRHYQSQIMINLETAQLYEYKGEPIVPSTFCWAGVKASASGLVLAVDGCVWSGPYELEFYDLSSPEHGWKQLPIARNPHISVLESDMVKYKWQGEVLHYRSFAYWHKAKDCHLYDLPPSEWDYDACDKRDLVLIELRREGDEMILERFEKTAFYNEINAY